MAGAYVSDPAAWRARGYGIATPEDLQYSGLLQQHPEWWNTMRGNPAWDNSPLNPRRGMPVVQPTDVQTVQPSSLRTYTRPTVSSSAGVSAPMNPVVSSAIGVMGYGDSKTAKAATDLGDTYTNVIAPQKKQTLTDFTRELLSAAPKNKAGNTADNDFLTTLFSQGGAGSVQGDLDRIANARSAASNAAARAATRAAGRTYNINRMASGDSSYLDRAYGDTLARIAAENASKLGDQKLANLQYLLQARNSNLGRRQSLNQSYLDSVINPYTQYNNLIQSDVGTIGQLGSLSL